MDNEGRTTTPPQVTPPAKTSGDSGEGSAKMYSEEELQKKLRGQGKQMKALEERLAQYESEKIERSKADEERKRKELEDQGKYKELLSAEETKRKQLEEKLNAISERETARLARVVTANEKRVAALPKELRDLVPEGLDADATADQIGKLEALTTTRAGHSGVYGGPARPGGSGTMSPEQERDAAKKANLDKMLGRKAAK